MTGSNNTPQLLRGFWESQLQGHILYPLSYLPTHILNKTLFKKYLCVLDVLTACMSVDCMCALSVEARRGHWVP